MIPAVLLDHLESTMDSDVRSLFSVFAGTSTGGILAAAFAKPGPRGVKARTLIEVYRDGSIALFPKKTNLVSRLKPERPANRNAMDHFLDYIGSGRLADASSEIVLPAYDLREQKVFLLTREAARSQNDDISLSEAVRATTAAPTFLPPVEASWEGGSRSFVDGGVFACNPALLTACALRTAYPRRRIRMLSLGCGTGEPEKDGRIKRQLLGADDDRTNTGWAYRFLKTSTHASVDAAHQAVASMLGPEDYLRISAPYAGPDIGLDHADDESFERMSAAADKAWDANGEAVVRFLDA